MAYKNPQIAEVAKILKGQLERLEDKAVIMRAPELRGLYAQIPMLKESERREFGQEINKLKAELEELVNQAQSSKLKAQSSIDVTAPFDVNTPEDKRPKLLAAGQGSKHPLTVEIEVISDIFYRMGFVVTGSRELDDEYHMFTSLNFPEDHPARDDYDTFMTEETDAKGHPLVAPAHTSTMQNRLLKKYKKNLKQGRPIAVLVPDRVFRNEDVDPRHEHTFYQYEGIYVDKGMHVGNLLATLKTFLSEYYGKELDVKTQPFYFPFTEPSFEFAMSCPFCLPSDASYLDAAQRSQEERANRTSGTESERQTPADVAMRQKPAGVTGSAGQQGKALRGGLGCNICSQTGWIELLGCGMIHPNVLKMAGIDPQEYTGYAWGGGVDRLVMMKYGVEDVRHFHSGKLEFLRQFK